MFRYLLITIALLLLAAQPTLAQRQVSAISDEVRERYALDPFYQKLLNADGLLFVSSQHVPDEALEEAAYLIDQVLAGRDDLRVAIAEAEIRLVIMNVDEYTTDVPEHARLAEQDRDWWDRRARGLGARGPRSAMSCGAENLLQYEGDPYSDENILIHEFAHVIDDVGLHTVDPAFEDRLQNIYAQAMDEGLWENAYGKTNRSEYWAELVQIWFFCNPPHARHDHLDINTRAELLEYDPRAYALMQDIFGDNDYAYQFPLDRADRGHLAGWDFDSAPSFAWPERLQRINPRLGPDEQEQDDAPAQGPAGEQDEPGEAADAPGRASPACHCSH